MKKAIESIGVKTRVTAGDGTPPDPPHGSY